MFIFDHNSHLKLLFKLNNLIESSGGFKAFSGKGIRLGGSWEFLFSLV